jgi:type II secretory pathway component PulK
MAIYLDELIAENNDSLVDGIVKDAVRQIPSYRQAPLPLTIDRVEQWLQTLAGSIEQNDPPILEHYLVAVAEERKEEGYPIGELHAIVEITEQHLRRLIPTACADEVECNANLAVLAAVMDAARMILSVTYILTARKQALSLFE